MNQEPVLEIDQIQGNILPGFRFPHQEMMACKLKPDSRFEKFIEVILPMITTMRESFFYREERLYLAKRTNTFGIASFSLPQQQNLFWLNIGLGRQIIMEYFPEVSQLDNSFNLGLSARSFLLGDSKDASAEGNKNNWRFGHGSKEADIFLIASSDKIETLDEETAKLRELIAEHNIELLYSERGERLPDEKEHFGFKDGISQPAIRGLVDTDGTPISRRLIIRGNEGNDTPEYSEPGKLLLWPGQFVFGYPKQSASHFRTPVAPTNIETSPLIKNGSFLVFRRLKQDVAEFQNQTQEMHRELTASQGFETVSYEDFIAKLVGRKKDGTTLLAEGNNPPPDFANDFNFKSDTKGFTLENGQVLDPVKSDPQGSKCPMFAHIRKVNPRDLATDQGAETNTATFRILRRGIPFGKQYNHTSTDDPANKEERGLLFLCYQTSIQNQFELLTNKWMNKEARPETNVGHDILVGQNNEEDSGGVKWCLFTANGKAKKLESQKPFVIPTAGGYFFCPSIAALAAISIKAEKNTTVNV